MSARRMKAARRAVRTKAGVSKQAERAEREFEMEVARIRMARNVDAEIRSLAPRRRRLAWTGLALVTLAIALLVWGVSW